MQQNEFKILNQYLTKLDSKDSNLKLYIKGIEELNLKLEVKDSEINYFLIQNPKTFPIINLGVQVFMKKSILRKRFLLGLSIIESDKNFTHLFLNQKDQKWVFFKFVCASIITFFFLIISFILFKFKRWI